MRFWGKYPEDVVDPTPGLNEKAEASTEVLRRYCVTYVQYS